MFEIIVKKNTRSHKHTCPRQRYLRDKKNTEISHENCLIDSSNIIYTIPEEQHKCQMTKNEEDSSYTKKNTEYLNKG